MEVSAAPLLPLDGTARLDGQGPVDGAVLLDRLVEAMLFEAPEALSAEALARRASAGLSARVTVADLEASVERLRERLAEGALDVFGWAGGFRLATRADLAGLLAASRPVATSASRKLSPSLLETLAVVAYRQPVTKPEVDFVRGVDSDYALRRLAELDLVAEAGRADTVGRPTLFATTPAFLDAFGFASLGALPPMREVEAVLNDPAFNRERARLLALHDVTSPSPETPASDA